MWKCLSVCIMWKYAKVKTKNLNRPNYVTLQAEVSLLQHPVVELGLVHPRLLVNPGAAWPAIELLWLCVNVCVCVCVTHFHMSLWCLKKLNLNLTCWLTHADISRLCSRPRYWENTLLGCLNWHQSKTLRTNRRVKLKRFRYKTGI